MPAHDALGDLLIRRLREAGQAVGEPITVAELHKVLLPYHRCRDTLGYATKAEYDLALLGLLRDPERMAIQEEALEEAVAEELESPEPGLGFLRDFAAAQVRVRARRTGPDAARAAGNGASAGEDGSAPAADGEEPVAPSGDPEGGAGEGAGAAEDWLEAYEPRVRAASPADSSPPEPSDAEAEPETWGPEGACWRCDRELPDRSTLRFCPFCGADQSVRRCLRCEEALDPGWSYCPRCGEEVGEA